MQSYSKAEKPKVSGAEASNQSEGGAVGEWRRGWLVVLAALSGDTLLGLGFMSFGTFMAPIEKEFGWSRTDVSIGFTAYAVAGILLAPFVGLILDRWGVRRIAIPGALFAGIGFALLATANGTVGNWLILWAVYASLNQLIMLTVWTSAVANFFVRTRGLAIAVTMMGSGVAASGGPLIANLLIDQIGWRGAFVAMGLGGGVVVALLCFVGLVNRNNMAALSDEAQSASHRGMATRDALRTASFIKLAVAAFVVYFVFQGLMVHLVPILSADGFSRENSVAIAGILGVAMICGKVVSGVLLDRANANWVSAIFLASVAAGMIVLSIHGLANWTRPVAVTLIGVGIGGTSPCLPYLVSEHFGMRNFGSLFGTLVSVYAVANAVSPVAASMVFDGLGSYHLALAVCPALLLVPIMLILSMKTDGEHCRPISLSSSAAGQSIMESER